MKTTKTHVDYYELGGETMPFVSSNDYKGTQINYQSVKQSSDDFFEEQIKQIDKSVPTISTRKIQNLKTMLRRAYTAVFM